MKMLYIIMSAILLIVHVYNSIIFFNSISTNHVPTF